MKYDSYLISLRKTSICCEKCEAVKTCSFEIRSTERKGWQASFLSVYLIMSDNPNGPDPYSGTTTKLLAWFLFLCLYVFLHIVTWEILYYCIFLVSASLLHTPWKWFILPHSTSLAIHCALSWLVDCPTLSAFGSSLSPWSLLLAVILALCLTFLLHWILSIY